MFFVLSKLLFFLLSPLFWFIFLVGLYFFRPQSRWKNYFKWSAVFIFFFFSNSVLFSVACRSWEIPGQKVNDVKKHDVAIVLGGMSEYNADLDVLSLRRQGDRIFQALTLYHTGKVKKLLITGDSGHLTDHGLHEARQMKAHLICWGIPAEDILTEEASVNTYENAQFTHKVFSQRFPELKSMILVTSGIHMKRALATFEKAGMHCTPHATDLYANQSGKFMWDQYLIPETDNFEQWNKLLKEMVGYLSYAVMGYL